MIHICTFRIHHQFSAESPLAHFETLQDHHINDGCMGADINDFFTLESGGFTLKPSLGKCPLK